MTAIHKYKSVVAINIIIETGRVWRKMLLMDTLNCSAQSEMHMWVGQSWLARCPKLAR